MSIIKSIRKSLTFYCLSTLLSVTPFASAMVADYSCPPPFYFRVEAGASFPRCLDLCVDTREWDPAREGYDTRPDRAPVVGAGVGYNINSWLSIGASTNYRGHFEYCKRQTPVITSDTPGFLGDKRRYFDFENTSYMVDLFFNRTGGASYYSYTLCNMSIAPYVGVGIGFARNVLYNFHTVQDETITVGGIGSNLVSSIINQRIERDFAWQVALGADCMINNCLGVGIGYRYFDAGCFRTNNYVVNATPPDFPTPTTISPWRGKFRANEVVASLNLSF